MTFLRFLVPIFAVAVVPLRPDLGGAHHILAVIWALGDLDEVKTAALWPALSLDHRARQDGSN